MMPHHNGPKGHQSRHASAMPVIGVRFPVPQTSLLHIRLCPHATVPRHSFCARSERAALYASLSTGTAWPVQVAMGACVPIYRTLLLVMALGSSHGHFPNLLAWECEEN